MSQGKDRIMNIQTIQPQTSTTILIKDLDSGMSHSVDPSFDPNVHKPRKINTESVWEQYWQQRQNLKSILFRLVNQNKIQKLSSILSQSTVNIQQYEYIDGWTLLHHAVNMRNFQMVCILVNNGANVNRKTSTMKRTALHLAVLNNSQQIIKFLLQQKANPNSQDIDFSTPVHYAVQMGYFRILKQFLEHKNVDFSIRDHRKMTPIDCCRDSKTKFLIESYCGKKNNFSPSKTYIRRFIQIDDDFSVLTKNRADYVEHMLNLRSQDHIEENKKGFKRNSSALGTKISSFKLKIMTTAAKKSVNAYNQSIAQSNGIQTIQNYDILKKIGSGSFGQVFLARKKQASKLYAIKRMQKRVIIKNKMKKYIQTQRQILKEFKHPFIITASSFFQDDWYLYIVMDFCEGGDLENFVKRQKLSEDITKKYCAQIILGLEQLHRKNYLFRDLKVANVLVDSEGHLKLTDFGLAKQTEISYSFLGSVAYLAPQMLTNTDNKMHSSVIDWYLLGVFCYELLTGYPPFYNNNIAQMHNNIRNNTPKIPSWISDECKDFLKKTLQKQPQKRLGIKGADQIKQHIWFNDIDWKSVQNRELQLPKPSIDQKQIRRKQILNYEEQHSGQKPENFVHWNYFINN